MCPRDRPQNSLKRRSPRPLQGTSDLPQGRFRPRPAQPFEKSPRLTFIGAVGDGPSLFRRHEMIARKTGALAGGLILAASLAPVVAGQGPVDDVDAIQRGARVFGAVARSSQIGVTVRDLDDE